MQDILLLLMTLFFLCTGILVPFVLSLGYVWVDVFSPHQISGSLLVNQPVAFIMGAAAVGIYLLTDRREPPKFTTITMLQIALGLWIVCTTLWAVVPEQAFAHLDLAIKVLGFATFLPWAIRSRVQIESLILVYLFSLAGHILPWGIKTMISGGGYQLSLGLLRVNSNILAESSTVSAIAVFMIPLMLSIRKYSLLLPKTRLVSGLFWVLVAICILAAVGTFARTALVAGAVTGIAMWLRSKHKIAFLFVVAILAGVGYSATSDRWTDRVSSITDYENEGSAFTRILVWRWGLNFVMTHPFGGGFWSFLVNQIEVPTPNGPIIQYGRAFHNVFVALLAEHGFIGFGLYVGLLVAIFLALQKAQHLTKHSEEHAWCADMAQAMQVAILTIYAAGNFVEIGWNPIVWYLLSISVCLREYARRSCADVLPTLADKRRGARPRTPLAAAATVPAYQQGVSSPGQR